MRTEELVAIQRVRVVKQNMPKTNTRLFAKIQSGKEHQKTMETPGGHIDALGRVEEK